MTHINDAAEEGKPALIGFPFDDNSSFLRGAAEAPPLIRAALYSDAANLWSENGTNLGEGARMIDAGDIAPVAGKDMFSLIEASLQALLDRKLRPISLGGDHSIVYPVMRAMSKKYPSLTALSFDAHPDLYDEFQGSRRSHACPFARIMEERLVVRLVQVGIRAMNGHQRRQAEKFRVEVIEMKDWRGILPELHSPLYVSFDLDALDPAFAPGVAHREPGGFSVRQVLTALQALRADVVGADLVEFNPRMDALNMTGVVCAKLVKELAAKMLASAGIGP